MDKQMVLVKLKGHKTETKQKAMNVGKELGEG